MMPKSELPLVSIITPVYNGAKYLHSLIASVRDQDYPHLEHIIIDDGSTDSSATVDVLKMYPHLRWWSRENRGQYATMNEGLDAAQGKIVCFISADDLMAGHAVQEAVDFLTRYPKFDGVYGKYKWVDESGADYWYQPLIKHAPDYIYQYVSFIAHCSLYIHRDRLVDRNLYFDSSLSYTGDYDWIMCLGKAGIKFGYINKTLSMVRWHNEQASTTKVSLVKQEIKMVMRKHGINRILHKASNVSINLFIVSTKLFSALFRRDRALRVQQITAWIASRRK